jgi:hypothetical protein
MIKPTVQPMQQLSQTATTMNKPVMGKPAITGKPAVMANKPTFGREMGPIAPQAPQQTPGGLIGNISNNPYSAATPSRPDFTAPDLSGASSGNASTGTSINIGRPYNANRQNPDGLGNFDQFRDSAWQQAMRHLQPSIDQNNNKFEQMMAARGIQAGTEQYDNQRSLLDRRNNDMLSQAAYGAQQQGLNAQNQFWNQGYQYDALANALNQTQIGANASMANARTGANASMYNAGLGAQASMHNAGLGAQASMYGADLAHALGLNRLNENARQFDINDIYRNQQLDLQGALGFGNLDLAQQGQDLRNWQANQNSNLQYMGLIQALMGNAPNASFQGGNMVGPMMQGSQNMMNAQANQANQAGGLLGAGLSMIPSWSDKRLKENIELVGSVHGVPVYEFDYKDKTLGASRYRGTMAQDIIKTHPEALQVDRGFYKVDYSKLPIDMEVIA